MCSWRWSPQRGDLRVVRKSLRGKPSAGFGEGLPQEKPESAGGNDSTQVVE